nr:D-alanyl-D-alanine carboxypeptidase/D-alanyl-D-alanine-endopeptidase [Alloalcanivorax marinus]
MPNADWPLAIQSRLQELNLPDDALALAAVPLDGPGQARFVNADRVMNPGSTMKLLTTYAALELLGPTFKWHTRVYTNGEVKGDVLEGDLILVGAGDPKLTEERLWKLMRDLRAYGIRAVHGDLVLDGGYFRLPEDGLPRFDDDGGDPHAPYLVRPDALLTNLNVFHIQMMGRPDRVQAWVEPVTDKVLLNNQLTRSNSRYCPSGHHLKAVPERREDGLYVITLTGSLPEGCKASQYLSLMDQGDYTGALLRGLWRQLGGEITGETRFGRLPKGASLLATSSSPDLVTMVRDINKWSSNIMARQLYLTIGAEHRLAEDSDDLAAANRTVREWMALKGMDPDKVVLDNGAGLSRQARISPMEQIKMLQQAWRSPFAAELIASLPLVAMDGTMHNRLRDTGLRGEGHIKTGSLTNVRAVAGFTRDRDNTTWAVSAIINTPAAWKSQAVLDDVLEAVGGLPRTDAATVSRGDDRPGRSAPGG